ncbi:copper-sensing transcriptional repressor CsoR [Caldinitratiruptor microaerophilus]|uniref:Copper-sensing transcriptional repressor CsoR n=1 Tax=Caldinitratiruptor microaerophilus TaxID=671077 RepID=A0AA35G5C9_9FIRM|nr:copper-sensing transcriptional repressor CsoR [Caldinitratiruptor microaerophilus]
MVVADEQESLQSLPVILRTEGIGLRDKADLLERLRKIEGQVRGLQRMVEEDRYCVDILVQLAAVRAALNRVAFLLLESHTRGCVAAALRRGDGEAAVQELLAVMDKLLKGGGL